MYCVLLWTPPYSSPFALLRNAKTEKEECQLNSAHPKGQVPIPFSPSKTKGNYENGKEGGKPIYKIYTKHCLVTETQS
jgi:hypothetical protein